MSEEQVFDSIWDAIEDTPQAAASMKARSSLMLSIQLWVKCSHKTQAEAAKTLGVTQPRMSDLMRGKISLFSLDSLMDMAATAGLDPQIQVRMEPVEGSVFEKSQKDLSEVISSGVVQEVRTLSDNPDNFYIVHGDSEVPTMQRQDRAQLKLVNIESKVA